MGTSTNNIIYVERVFFILSGFILWGVQQNIKVLTFISLTEKEEKNLHFSQVVLKLLFSKENKLQPHNAFLSNVVHIVISKLF